MGINPTLIYEWRYCIKDHLGNTRVLFTDKNGDGLINQSADEGLNEVLAFYKYAPFGLELGGSHQNGRNSHHRYQYNGKEWTDALNWYDYGARWYDPAVGRWGQVDPLAGIYASSSPYNYGLGNPIRFIDPDGRRVTSDQDLDVAEGGMGFSDWIPSTDNEGNISYTAESEDSYYTFSDQYGEEAAREVFGNDLTEEQKNYTYNEGEGFSSARFYPLNIKRDKSANASTQIISQLDSDTPIANMNDVLNQVSFMTEYNKYTKESTFDLRLFFNGLPKDGAISFEGKVKLENGKTTTAVMDVLSRNERSLILDKTPSTKANGEVPNFHSIAMYYSSSSTKKYIPNLILSIRNAKIEDYVGY